MLKYILRVTFFVFCYSMEEEYEKNPLLRHFYVYMQVFLSQALEPGFLDEVRKTNGWYFSLY